MKHVSIMAGTMWNTNETAVKLNELCVLQPKIKNLKCIYIYIYLNIFLLYYKITGMLKTIKIPISAPTCFGSRRNHHQGAISCLAQ